MGWNPQPPTRKYRGFFFGKHGHPPPPLQLVGQGGRGGKFRAKDVGKSGEEWLLGRSQGFQGGNSNGLLKGFPRLCTYIYIHISIIYVIMYYSILCTMYYVSVLCCVVYYIIDILSCIVYIIYTYIYIYMYYVFLPWLHFPIYRQILLTHSGAMRCAWQMWLGCFADGPSVFALKNARIIGRILQFVYCIFIVHENNDWCCVIPCIYMYVRTYIRFRCLKIVQ